MKITRFLPGDKLILLPAERQPTFTGHFHGAITHNQHLFGNFFPFMGLENTHNFKIMSVCVVPLTLLWALLCHGGWLKSW